MKIKFTDVNGLVLSNIEVNFLVGKKPDLYVTNNEGVIEFFDADEGDDVTCYIHKNDKQVFTYKEGEVPVIKIEAPLIDMIFVTIDDNDESVIGATVYFEYLDKKVELLSDNTGQILLKKIPVNTDVKVYQIHKSKEVNVEINTCKKDKAQYFISVDKYFDFSNMKFKLVDKSGQVIRGADVRFKVGGSEFESVTNQDGRILIEEVKVGSVVECKQMIFGKSLPWHKFKCESDIDEYILHGERPQLFNQSSEKYDSQVRMKFRLVNSKSQPIPNAVLRLEFGEKVRNKYTNQSGEAMVDDVLIGDKVIAFVDLRGTQVNAEFICQEDDEMHEIILKTNSPKMYFWLIPVIVILGLGIFYANSNFSGKKSNSENNEKDVSEKDTLLISNYFVQVSDANTGEKLFGSKVKLVYIDTVFEKFSDKDGLAKFDAIEHKLPQKFEISAVGYFSVNQDYTLDSLFSVKITRNDSIEVVDDNLVCNSLVQSADKKITIRSFKMNVPKGRFKLWANLFDFPNKVEVYNGKPYEISQENLVYTTNGFIRGIVSPYIEFESPDSIVTVSLTGKIETTSWVCKVYCARRTVPIVP